MLKTERILEVFKSLRYNKENDIVKSVKSICIIIKKNKNKLYVFDGIHYYNVYIKLYGIGWGVYEFERLEKIC